MVGLKNGGIRVVGVADDALGHRSVNVEPVPAPSLWTATLPPWSSTSDCTMVNPTPRPPSRRAMLRSPCTKMPNTFGSSAGVIPMPSSRTWISTNAPSTRALISMRP
jgi:hypothetical protein